MKIDKLLKAELEAVIAGAVKSALESAEERWLSAEQLQKQFACFSATWMKANAHKLPRVRLQGSNRWCYPQHRINRMLCDGTIANLA